MTTKNNDDRVDCKSENGIMFIDIYSPTGISSADFELQSGMMPEDIVLQLRLKGLEKFRLKSAQDDIAASVSSSDAMDIHQEMLKAGESIPLRPDHALWLKIERVSPFSEEGYFEIILPKEFIRKADKSFEIEWIDFYR